MEPTPTADLDRTNDRVYDSTTAVVRAIMELTQGVQQTGRVEYLELVRKVGLQLRNLLGSVDELVDIFPVNAKHEVCGSKYLYRNITSGFRFLCGWLFFRSKWLIKSLARI